MATKQNTNQILTMIQNLPADEQSNLINAMRMLEVNAQDEQYFTNVTKAMQAAGWNPIKRATAGVKAALRNKMETTKGINSGKVARGMRLFGMRKTADFIDRWFTSAPKKKFKEIKTPKPTNTESSGVGNREIIKSLLIMKTQLNDVQVRIMDIGDDVTDIKSLLMPKGVVAKSKKGDTRFVQFNPLAPPGEQFNTITESGKLTAMKPGKEFQQSAQKKAALATAQLALKIIEKDKARAELKKKYEFKDEAESYDEGSPLEELRTHLDERLDKIEGMFEKKSNLFQMISALIASLGGKIASLLGKFKALLSPVFKILSPIARAIVGVAKWAGKFGMFVMKTMWNAIRAMSTGIWKLIGKWFPGLGIPGLIGGAAAVATTGAMAVALDKGMKQGADKAIDGVLTDVTGNIRNAKKQGFEYSEEEKYKMYKDAMDKSMATEDAKRPGRAEYRKQQWQNSEGLSDEERGMARRYFYEKEGGAKGPKSRGGARGQTIPAEIMAEGSDTVDTNYADVPVAPAPTPPPPPAPSKPAVGGTGALEKKTVIRGEEDIKNQIKKHEGLRLKPYKDSVGKWTIGYGHLIGDGTTLPKEWDRTITKEEADALFEKDYAEHRKAAAAIPGFEKLNAKGKRALIDLTYNMGADWVRVKGFKRFEKAMSQKTPDVEAAARALEDSLWYKQVKGRAKTVVGDLRAGLDMRDISPMPTIPGSQMDAQSRAYQASTMGSSSGVTVVNAPVVNNTKVSNTVGKRPAQKAEVLAQDKSLVRTVGKDVQHPAYG